MKPSSLIAAHSGADGVAMLAGRSRTGGPGQAPRPRRPSRSPFAHAAGSPPGAWSASDCASATTRRSTPNFQHSAHGKSDQSCATCHKNVAEHFQSKIGRRDGRPDSVAQDAQGARGQRHLPDLPREGRARELARRHARPPRHRLHLLPQRAQLQVGEGAAEDGAATPKPASPATSRCARSSSARRITRCAKARWTARAATTRTTRRSRR